MAKVEVVIATRNAGKLREIQDLLAPLGLSILSLWDFPKVPEIVEDRRSFEENALKKARSVARLTGRVAIADDSGLSVDALQGRPGVFSSRYAGDNATDADRCRKLLEEMGETPPERRKAAFICAMAVASPAGKTKTAVGRCRGEIAPAPRGTLGFGYDPVFLIPKLGKTMGEVEPAVKNRISHRARALEKLKIILPDFLKETE